MSVPKHKRKESKFEVEHHFRKVRKEITDLLLRDFGYSIHKSDANLNRMFGGIDYADMTDEQKRHYDKRKHRDEAFHDWFIGNSRSPIIECMREIMKNIKLANSIWPVYREEFMQRRRCQNLAIGECYRLKEELEYSIETLPVDVNVYLRFVRDIDQEIKLLQGWKKSDRRQFEPIVAKRDSEMYNMLQEYLKPLQVLMQGAVSEHSARFANANRNGNSNNNNASNSNAVRPISIS